MRRVGLALTMCALAMLIGCKRKKTPAALEAGAPVTSSAPTASIPPPPPPPFSPPEASAGDVFLIARGGVVIHVDPKGKITRETKVSIRDITSGPGGTIYGVTMSDVRQLTKNTWKTVKPFGDKTSAAIALSKSDLTLRVTGGVRGSSVSVLTQSQLWSGVIDENGMIGGDHGYSNAQLDGAGKIWGLGADGKLVTRPLIEDETPKWAPANALAYLTRTTGKGAFALTADRVVFNGPDGAGISVTLPFAATASTQMRVGSTDVCAIRSNDDVALVTPAGGITTTKVKLGDVWTVDGRARTWTLDAGELRVTGIAGHVIASKAIPAAMKPGEVSKIVVFGAGADLN